MLNDNKGNNYLRFFSNSSIVKNNEGEGLKPSKDPKPFGLNYQEEFDANKGNDSPQQGITMGSSPTNSPSGSDSCLDVDYEF